MATRFACKQLDRTDDGLVVRTCEVRLTGPFHLVAPNSDGKYGVRLLFPKGADLSALEAVCEEMAEREHGKNWRKKGVKMPFNDQTAKAKLGYDGFEEGAIYINTSTKYEPRMFDKDPAHDLDGSEVYPGMWALVKLKAYSWKSMQQGSGISLGLESLQKVKDDEKFSGGEGDDNPAEGYEVIDDDDDDDAGEGPNPFK